MSEPEKCLSVGKNFSRREWLMLILILLMLEGGVLVASHALMSDLNVLNYISFASTIASLILAVLAIVYGFYQSESQRKVGDGIEAHLSRIIKATDNMGDVSRELNESAQHAATLGSSIQGLDNSIERTLSLLSQLNDSMQNMSQEQGKVFSIVSALHESKSSSSTSSVPVASSLQAAEKLLFNMPSIVGLYTAYALNIIFQEHPKSVFSRDRFTTTMARIMASLDGSQPTVREWSASIITTISIFRSADLFDNKIIDGQVTNLDKLKLTDGAFELLQSAARASDADSEMSETIAQLKKGFSGFTPMI